MATHPHNDMDYIDMSPQQLEQLASTTFSSNRSLNLGPFILGSSIDALLCGILLMQYGSYVGSCARDGWLLKAMVAYVVAMNLWATGFAWAWVWDLFVQNFGTYRTFFSVKYLSWDGVINTGIVFAVQAFFALRAWKMVNRNRFFAAMILTLMLAIAGSGLALKVLYSRYPYTLYSDKMKVPAYICLCSMVVVDLSITSIILFHVLCWRGINQRSDRLLGRLARITFESQLPPTMAAIGLLVVYSIKCDSFFMPPLIWIQPKLYGISLLHTLNTRASLAQPSVIFGTSYTGSSRAGPPTVARNSQKRVQPTIGTVFRIGQSWSTCAPPNEFLAPKVPSSDDEHITSTLDVVEINVPYSSSPSLDTDAETFRTGRKCTDLEAKCEVGARK